MLEEHFTAAHNTAQDLLDGKPVGIDDLRRLMTVIDWSAEMIRVQCLRLESAAVELRDKRDVIAQLNESIDELSNAGPTEAIVKVIQDEFAKFKEQMK